MTASGSATTLLLDTDVFSFVLKDDSRAALYRSMLTGHNLVLSFMTIAEIYQWASLRNWGRKRLMRIEHEFQSYAIISVADQGMCRIWAAIRAARRVAGHPLGPQDAWVAAAALRHSLPLVTHNAKDYQGIANLDLRTATP